MRERNPCVYILANRWHGALNTGVTSDLVRRVWEHRTGAVDGFTKRYAIHTLVWYEQHGTMVSAIAREKAIKEWRQAWKVDLIEKENPSWKDHCPELV